MSSINDQGAGPPGLTPTQAASTTSNSQKDDVQMADEPDYEPSEASSYDPAAALLDNISQPSKKRRQSTDPTDAQQPKKVRLGGTGVDPTVSKESHELAVNRAKQLPGEIWQHIFTLVPPRDLGRLLIVNKLFHVFLSPSAVGSAQQPSDVPSSLPPLKPDAIWQASRRLFWPRMPAPLKGKSELQMWRLVCSTSCQLCGCKSQKNPRSSKNEAWRSGPGPADVCPIFSFCVFTCGNCLKKNGVKEIDLLLSPSFPSFLLPALPPILVDTDMHVIPLRAMQMGILPPDTQVTKLFWAEHVEQVKAEFTSVKALGSAAAEEWIKGLEIRGKQVLVDASRWEKWAGAGGITHLRVESVAAKADVSASAASFPAISLPNKPLLNVIQKTDKQQTQTSDKVERHGSSLPLEANAQLPQAPAQQKRTKEEAARLKAQRRADIERRAMLLDPPLTADVLAHIPSFQAALQLITPLDDGAWELLKPRLLAQREEAEQRVKQTSTNAQFLHEGPGKKDIEKKPVREPREVTDEEWDETQGPVRARISEYADEIIESWNNGAKIKKKTCPQFAADVLRHVRKRFYAEIAKDKIALVAAGKRPIVEPPEGPWTQKLTLENMKWVFDVKVKPRTEPLRKDLFLCNGCLGGTGMLKFFGFEGVLQHYAAKHTIALSLGNIVVHWRAEWPEVPPFCPDPRTKEKAYYEKGPSNSQQSKNVPLQQAYLGFRPGPPTGYLPHVYGAEAPPVPHYHAEPHVPIPPVTPYSQAGAHAYSGPHLIQPYHDTAAYGSNPPRFPLGMPHGSHDYSNDYATPVPPVPSHFDYEPYPSQNDTDGATSTGTPQHIQPDTVARSTHSAWSKVGCNKKIPPPVRALAVIHHAARTFRDTHGEPLSLGTFIDALAKSRKLRTFRSLNGVACKACDSEVFHLPKLANHFKTVHEDLPISQGLAPMDWLTDMIKLPEEERLAGLAGMLREDMAAYSLVEEAIPWVFDQAFVDKFCSKLLKTRSNNTLPAQEPKQPPPQAAAFIAGEPSKEEHLRNAVEQVDNTQQSDHPISSTQPQSVMPPIATTLPTRLQVESGQDIAPLRPASEVYGRKTRQASAVKPRPSDPAESNLSRGKTERELVVRRPSHHAKPRHWRDEQSSDHRDAREQRYSGTEPAGHRDRSASVGNHPHENHPPGGAGANSALGYVEVEEPSVVQKHQAEEEEEEVVYVDEYGREIGRGRRARNTLPREPRYGVPDERRFGDYDYPSSWYGDHLRYQDSSPRPRYTQPGYHYRPEPPAAPHRAYYDRHSTRPLTEYPAEAYELVEVRDPNGDYFVRRPVRRDDRPYYVYETRPPPREQSVYPTQRYVEGPSGYGVGSQANAPIPTPAPRPAYDDYDPRYPSSIAREPPAYRGNQ
ncbi:hypothetical protein FLAG1_01360 [Fusarium langsethiae]|uniref:DUF7892 domain-containing protein n=1 Tax=Fusarium langsethiae TaxID=179993 RepID=A0A0N0DHK6_FUSLA|nr:hypothetical protein FLAG1_01360 [Fusarium langsethiae]GKT99269.1 unnamed protein product [Fusarium langsethiae]GKU13737.1 unnamed protein product [Fusarium langsethiae]